MAQVGSGIAAEGRRGATWRPMRLSNYLQGLGFRVRGLGFWV